MSLRELRVIRPNGSRIRNVIDPNNTLPYVEFLQDGKANYRLGNFSQLGLPIIGFNVHSENGLVGVAGLSEREDTNEIQIANIRIDARRKGYGLASYLLAIEAAHAENKPFINDVSLSPDAMRVWDKFIDLGIAEIGQPFELDWEKDPPCYTGYAIIRPN